MADGPPAAIAVRVGFYVDVPGTSATDGFSRSLQMELAKYTIVVTPLRPYSTCVAVITLGSWTDRMGAGNPDGLLSEDGLSENARPDPPDPLEWGPGALRGASPPWPLEQQSIQVEVWREGAMTAAGRLRVPDFQTTTLDVAAEETAAVIARALRVDVGTAATVPCARPRSSVSFSDDGERRPMAR